ncbi:hypothetical protein [Arthrobacter russicus]|uniref:Uncharacterized protein n=1 Tax=Arthrobacter russicus TaxID=172040 RepID=A0ABU1JES8_9MICC|nr:hypothetical protein [Arthrobacter russicus]MDR6270629.1 hypothetical protein [Arthrobacter russicus]
MFRLTKTLSGAELLAVREDLLEDFRECVEVGLDYAADLAVSRASTVLRFIECPGILQPPIPAQAIAWPLGSETVEFLESVKNAGQEDFGLKA